ncbi:hypothetical protein HDU98_009387, partial [Podochytrium sp. JEL0797]
MATLVSQRIEFSDDQHRGTIRFDGTLEGKAWLGIEWDIPSRGKHSGQHPKDKAVFLFRVAVPNSASFVRQDSPKVLLARSFLCAVREKYIDASQGNNAFAHQSETTRSSGLKHKEPGADVEVEMVGWDKMRKKLSELAKIEIVGLAGMQIGWVNVAIAESRGMNPALLRQTESDQAPTAIRDTFPLVQDLDLSRNLFSSWQDVARITMQLPHLESLRLNSNRLRWLDTDAALLTSGFSNIKFLALNSTNLAWDDIEKLATHTPNLASLFFGFNGLSTFGPKYSTPPTPTNAISPLFPHLKEFHLEQNSLSSWPDLCTLIHTHMPLLTTLNLKHNQIASIPSPTSTQFLHLTTLNLACNNLTSYTSIHALNAFPQLVDIRVRDNPVLAVNPPSNLDGTFHPPTSEPDEHASQSDQLAARLSKATRINGKQVSPRERSDAELYYLGKVAHWIHALKATAAAGDLTVDSRVDMWVEEYHPRFGDLVAKHGMPQVAPLSATSNALKDRLVRLLFCLVEDGEGKSITKRVEKRVPLNMTM